MLGRDLGTIPAVTRSLLSVVLACALIAAACSSDGGTAPTTMEPTTTVAPTTSSSTTTTPPTTTTTPPRVRTLRGDLPEPLLTAAEDFYSWLVDRSNPKPGKLADGLVKRVEGVKLDPGGMSARGGVAVLKNGDRVGAVRTKDGTLVMVRTGDGWEIVATLLEGERPWIAGANQRTMLVLGSDARPGQDQTRLRADSVHLLTLNLETGEGAFVGFPRDSWIGGRKLTDHMPSGGPEYMVDLIEDTTDLEIGNYALVGFEGFRALVKELGSLEIDLPTRMRSGNTWDNFPEGPQTLTPSRTLQLARIRKGLPAGDFDRSFNQGLVTLAAMTMIKSMGIGHLPRWVATFDEHGFTDLNTTELATWMAAAYVATPETVTNRVLPASVGSVGAASVVFLGDAAEGVFRDLEDGLLDD